MRRFGLTLVLSALALTACSGSDDGDGGLSQIDSGVYSLFDPVAASKIVPFPVDLLFDGSNDGTVNVQPAAGATNPPFVTDANRQDGFSTVASLFTDLIGRVDLASANAPGTILVINGRTGVPLSIGVDYRVTQSNVIDPGTGLPLDRLRTRLLIEPLKPLDEATTYLVVVTKALKSVDGVRAESADLFKVITSATPVSAQTMPILAGLNPTQKATLERLRQIYTGAILPKLSAIGTENIVIAWPVTTQSVTASIKRLQSEINAAAPQPLMAVNSGLKIDALVPSFPPIADVYLGSLDLPYYLADATPGGDDVGIADNPLNTFWRADPAVVAPGIAPSGSSCAVPTVIGGNAVCLCSSLEPSESTTGCFPMPKARATQTVPVLMSVPNAASGHTMPAAGWPVAIFQHGITGDRSQMAPLTAALTQAGFAVIAIDLPLHGIVDPDSRLRVTGTTERTFGLNLVNNATGAPPADTLPDASGTHFINLSSVITSRDNLRQAAVDLMTLTRALDTATLLQTTTPTAVPTGEKLDGTKVRFIGHSLGGIVGGTYLGVNDTAGASVLAMPGGGIAKLLDASSSFGPRIAAGLEASSAGSIKEGNDNYETFLRFAQTLVDAGDPINYAVAAAVKHPILMLEVKGDAVVPNCAVNDENCTAMDTIPLSGYLSGTDPLARVMGLSFVPGPTQYDGLDVAPNAGAPAQMITGAAARLNVVRFNQGDHGSILSPQASMDVTCEMQAQVATFLATDGAVLKIGNPCPPAAAPAAAASN